MDTRGNRFDGQFVEIRSENDPEALHEELGQIGEFPDNEMVQIDLVQEALTRHDFHEIRP